MLAAADAATLHYICEILCRGRSHCATRDHRVGREEGIGMVILVTNLMLNVWLYITSVFVGSWWIYGDGSRAKRRKSTDSHICLAEGDLVLELQRELLLADGVQAVIENDCSWCIEVKELANGEGWAWKPENVCKHAFSESFCVL